MITPSHLLLTIDALEADYLYIQQSQISNAGNGLYTAIPIYKNEIISLYKGEIINKNEAQKRIENKADGYFINMLNGKIMDSNLIDCFAKYANDANGISKNNIFINNAFITLNEKKEICLVATKNIKAFQEILCDYGKAYWENKT